MELMRRRGESKDASQGGSPRVPDLALIGQSLEWNQGSRGDRGRLVKLGCHVACLVFEVAPACEGDELLLLLLDCNRELYRPYRDQNSFNFLKGESQAWNRK